jgi:hypothetical protein
MYLFKKFNRTLRIFNYAFVNKKLEERKEKKKRRENLVCASAELTISFFSAYASIELLFVVLVVKS